MHNPSKSSGESSPSERPAQGGVPDVAGEGAAESTLESTRETNLGHATHRASSGQLDEFRDAYEAIAPSLHAWVRLRSVTGGIDPDDVLQEVWLRAIEHGSSFDPLRGSFRAWIFGLAKHAYYEALRSRAARREVPGGAASVALAAWPDLATSIQTRLARDETIQQLIDHVSDAEEVDRSVLIHCGLEGMPCTLVATRLGLSAEAVTKRWQRLRARLRTTGVEVLLR